MATTIPPTRPSVGNRAAQPKKIFFSYGHDANRELVDRFKVDLEKRGHSVWIDYKEIGAWDDWKGRITQGIYDCNLAIAFLSMHSTRDPGVCRNEIAMALHHFGTVYPMLVESVPQESIPVSITHLQWPDLSRWSELKSRPDPREFEQFYEEKLLEIVSRVEGEATRFASEVEVLRRVLDPSSFDSKFAQHLEGFVGREWVFNEFERWLDQQPDSRVFWIKAGPGFGKTALAVNLANRYRGAVVGTWFCDHQSTELSDPLRAVRTLAFQLALRWDDYRARLLPRLGQFAGSSEAQIAEARETLAKKNLKDLFELLLAGPLAGLIWREHKLVILMDALDEVSREDAGHNELAALISREFLELPKWISFVVTSRPDALVSGHLQRFKPFEIAAEDGRNEADLRSYVQERILPLEGLQLLPEAEQGRITEALVGKCAGMVLYLRMVEESLKEGTLEPGQIETMESGLAGLHSQYYQVFDRRFGSGRFAETVQPLLRLVLAAPGPLPLALAEEVLGISKEEARRMRSQLGAYLVEGPNGLGLFHKTLGEWVTGSGSGMFYTDSESACTALGARLWRCFEERKENAYGITETLRWETQVLEWLPGLFGAIGKNDDADCLTNLAELLNERLKWDQNEALCRRALERREKALGVEHPDTLTSVNNLGNLLLSKGDYEGAEALCRRALEGREKALGVEHPDTLTSVNNLGNLLKSKGDYEGAEALYRRALEGREKALGMEHPDTLRSVNNLGISLSAKGNDEGAEALYRRAVEGKEKALGAEHPDTLTSVNNLGNLLKSKGDYEGAEALFRRALEGQEKVLGAEHPHTLRSVNSRGSLLRSKGDYEGAETLYRRALEGREKSLGAEHPETLSSVNDLAVLLEVKGDYSEAEELYRLALVGREKALGAEHPDTLMSVDNLADLLETRGDYPESESLYRRVLQTRRRVLGAEHPDTLESVDNLAVLLGNKGDYSEAEELFRLALVGYEKALGAEHPDTLRSVNNLGNLLSEKGDYEGAEALCRRALEGREKALGAEHPDTLESVNNLGNLLSNKGENKSAADLVRKWQSYSLASADAVRYNLACYECLSGNLEEAKHLIAEHLELHPEEKDQALSDEDFATIRVYITSL